MLEAMKFVFQIKEIKSDLIEDEFYNMLELLLQKKLMHGNTGTRWILWQIYRKVSVSD